MATTDFTFLHTYEPTGRYWKGLEKSGLLRPGNGIRLVNSPWGREDRRFNTVAQVGGPLHRILNARRCHFIVDRVVGGSPYCDYNFDQELVQRYAAMLGNRFLGGQVHETICNTHNDWQRLKSQSPQADQEPLAVESLRSFFNWKDEKHWLEYGRLEDYAGRLYPSTRERFWREVEWNAKRQAARFAGHFSACEGSSFGSLAWRHYYAYGASRCFAEVGVAASRQTQFVIACLRGAAKAAGKPWGVFFAPWGPNSGCTSFIPEKNWSWQCPRTEMDKSGWPIGPEDGPSSAMQRRIFFHAYLSGANTLHEEWGAEGNLLDWDSGKFSSYGRVTRDLLDFQRANPDVGEPYTPIALVLDAHAIPEATKASEAVRYSIIRFGPDDETIARRSTKDQEMGCFPPCAIPEIFDVVPSDAPRQLWSRYQTIILIGSASIPEAKRVPIEDQPRTFVEAALAASPFERKTHLVMQLNWRQSDGAWIVGLHNPWGARRGDVEKTGSLLDSGCAIRDTLRAKFKVKSARTLHAWPASSNLDQKGDHLNVVVGPGGILVLEVIPG